MLSLSRQLNHFHWPKVSPHRIQELLTICLNKLAPLLVYNPFEMSIFFLEMKVKVNSKYILGFDLFYKICKNYNCLIK